MLYPSLRIFTTTPRYGYINSSDHQYHHFPVSWLGDCWLRLMFWKSRFLMGRAFNRTTTVESDLYIVHFCDKGRVSEHQQCQTSNEQRDHRLWDSDNALVRKFYSVSAGLINKTLMLESGKVSGVSPLLSSFMMARAGANGKQSKVKVKVKAKAKAHRILTQRRIPKIWTSSLRLSWWYCKFNLRVLTDISHRAADVQQSHQWHLNQS